MINSVAEVSSIIFVYDNVVLRFQRLVHLNYWPGISLAIWPLFAISGTWETVAGGLIVTIICRQTIKCTNFPTYVFSRQTGL